MSVSFNKLAEEFLDGKGAADICLEYHVTYYRFRHETVRRIGIDRWKVLSAKNKDDGRKTGGRKQAEPTIEQTEDAKCAGFESYTECQICGNEDKKKFDKFGRCLCCMTGGYVVETKRPVILR